MSSRPQTDPAPTQDPCKDVHPSSSGFGATSGTYSICPNRGLDLYFFPEIFDPASFRARLLLKLPDYYISYLALSPIKNVCSYSCEYIAWPPLKVCVRLVLSRKRVSCTIPESAWCPHPSLWLPPLYLPSLHVQHPSTCSRHRMTFLLDIPL